MSSAKITTATATACWKRALEIEVQIRSKSIPFIVIILSLKNSYRSIFLEVGCVCVYVHSPICDLLSSMQMLQLQNVNMSHWFTGSSGNSSDDIVWRQHICTKYQWQQSPPINKMSAMQLIVLWMEFLLRFFLSKHALADFLPNAVLLGSTRHCIQLTHPTPTYCRSINAFSSDKTPSEFDSIVLRASVVTKFLGKWNEMIIIGLLNELNGME